MKKTILWKPSSSMGKSFKSTNLNGHKRSERDEMKIERKKRRKSNKDVVDSERKKVSTRIPSSVRVQPSFDVIEEASNTSFGKPISEGKNEPPQPAEKPKGQARYASKVNPFLRSWVWKREGKPDRERFEKPYMHRMLIDDNEQVLTVQQRRFQTLGFASTVWDSSIVLAKYFEKHAELVRGKKCIELGSGCGLVGLVMASLQSASTTLTDLSPNLPLLKENRDLNKLESAVEVKPLKWGCQEDLSHYNNDFDVIVAADVMYDHDSIEPLIQTLDKVSNFESSIFLAYGRNRWAEETFFDKGKKYFSIEKILNEDLDEVYQCVDVDVFVVKKLLPGV